MPNLVIQRKPGEKVLVTAGDKRLDLTVVKVKPTSVVLAFEAPRDVKILRAELSEKPDDGRKEV